MQALPKQWNTYININTSHNTCVTVNTTGKIAVWILNFGYIVFEFKFKLNTKMNANLTWFLSNHQYSSSLLSAASDYRLTLRFHSISVVKT